MSKVRHRKTSGGLLPPGYAALRAELERLLETARRTSARAVNAVMTATYWEIGRRIVQHEQGGRRRAGYGEQLLEHLAADLTQRFGRGFSRQNLQRFRHFYLAYPCAGICPTVSGKSPAGRVPAIGPTASGVLALSPAAISETPRASWLSILAQRFPLPWSHYVLLLDRSRAPAARAFYEGEALRGGWSVRQLARQMDSQFYERTALSRDKAALLRQGAQRRLGDAVAPEEEIKDPLVLEFLGLKDEYSESDLEAALVRRMESFLLELGGDFAFVGRQRRLRIGGQWFRVDLLFFHRRLRSLVIIDLKLGEFNHADAGQMHLYLNYARAHWVVSGENPPVGLILCARKDEVLARYALEGLPNKVMAAEYRTALPDERLLAAEIEKARRMLEARRAVRPGRRGGP